MEEKIFKVRIEILITFFLVIITLAVYSPLKEHEFTSFDDPFYVTDNSHIKNGITADGVRWAFSTEAKERVYWHPLTWLSHMIDVQLYGMDAGRHLLINLLLHTLNALLLFYVLRKISGDMWPSAVVAALFALHPINVESVAWVAARKNVLSTLFWALTLLVYTHYVQQPGLRRYLMVLSTFVLGLLSKLMLVTLPCVLLLLDFWPFGRVQIGSSNTGMNEQGKRSVVSQYKPLKYLHLLFEKIPLMILAALAIHFSAGSLEKISFEAVPLSLRFQNAVVSYVQYLGKMIWPHNLAYFYPFPHSVPTWQIIGSCAILIIISFGCIRTCKTRPYLIVGWLWYLGTLLPVIGIIQVGLWPALADRWAYVPFIGIFIMIAWAGKDIAAIWRYNKFTLGALVAIVLLVFILNTRLQIAYWQNSYKLYAHALTATSNNATAHYDMGCILDLRGRGDEAFRHYEQALYINPNFPAAHINMGNSLMARGQIAEATKHFQMALQINPKSAIAHNSLGVALVKQGDVQEALHHYALALRLDPDYPMAHNNIGAALKKQGKISDAIRHYLKALKLKPEYVDAHYNLGLVLANRGKLKQAIFHFQKALEINPENEVVKKGYIAALEEQAKIDNQVGVHDRN